MSTPSVQVCDDKIGEGVNQITRGNEWTWNMELENEIWNINYETWRMKNDNPEWIYIGLGPKHESNQKWILELEESGTSLILS